MVAVGAGIHWAALSGQFVLELEPFLCDWTNVWKPSSHNLLTICNGEKSECEKSMDELLLLTTRRTNASLKVQTFSCRWREDVSHRSTFPRSFLIYHPLSFPSFQSSLLTPQRSTPLFFLRPLSTSPPFLLFLCRPTVKVKSNPFLMESNCMKMYRAGLRGGREKTNMARWKEKEMKNCVCALVQTGNEDGRWEKERKDEGNKGTRWVVWEQVWERANQRAEKRGEV